MAIRKFLLATVGAANTRKQACSRVISARAGGVLSASGFDAEATGRGLCCTLRVMRGGLPSKACMSMSTGGSG